jgi:hypothetical protein
MVKKMSPLEKPAAKQKLPTIIDLLNKSLETTGITTLARQLSNSSGHVIEYTNLSTTIKGKRKLPLKPAIALCKMHGLTADQTLFVLAEQEIVKDDDSRLASRKIRASKKTPASKN